MRVSILLISCILLCAHTIRAEATGVLAAREDSISFTAVSIQDTIYTLPAAWLLFDSLRVFRNYVQIAEYTHWRLLDPGNRLWLYNPLGPKDTLQVFFSYRPIPLFRSYYRRSLATLAKEKASYDSSRVLSIGSPLSRSESGWTRLNKSGSLIRSVQIGTGQDLELESALNLQIEGRVGKNIDVVAALTDQSTPIQPEGTTEEISELEKVFVSIRSPRLAATIGDYDLKLDGGRYDTYERKLTGVRGDANYPVLQGVISGAVSDGEFSTNSFRGQEAVQGPYSLTGQNGEVGIVVLAGTETVWVDGEVMRRGEGNDYTIDYSAGEITFTANRLITEDSRIIVDFEYANEDYERLYGASRLSVGGENSPVRVSASWISESDDDDRPLGRTLNEEEREILRAAGDTVRFAVGVSADSLGPGQGDYVRRDTLYNGETYFIFVRVSRDTSDAPTGSWDVLFDDFGLGNGDYEADADTRGRTFFRWVGPGEGRYLPQRRLPLPEEQTLADLRVDASPVSGVQTSIELAASRYDRNTLSQFDNADNDGTAIAGRLSYTKQQPNILSIRPYSVNWRNELRYRDRSFTDISRVQEIEFDRDWDVSSSTSQAETVYESNLSLSPVRQLSLNGGLGLLDRESIQETKRYSGGVRYNQAQHTSASVSHLQILSDDHRLAREGDWIRQRGEARAARGRFSPRVTIDRERKRDEYADSLSGFRYLDYRTGMGIALPVDLSVDGEFGRRIDERLTTNDVYVDSATAITYAAEAGWRPVSVGWTKLRYVHREKNFSRSDSADITTDVGRLESLLSPPSRLLELNLTYELAKTRTQDQILVAIEVEPGNGDYRVGGEGEPSYVPDDQGNIILVSRNAGTFEPASELKFNSLLWLRPDETSDSNLAPWIRALSTETELSIEERSRLPLDADLILLNQSSYRGDSTIFGRLSLRQDLHILRLSRKLAIRLRYRMSESVQNQILNGGQLRLQREGAARVRAQYTARLRGESEASLSRETDDHLAGIIPSSDIDRFSFRQEVTYTFSRFWEAGLGVTALELSDEDTQTQASVQELKPRGGLSLPGRGRIDADFTWRHASSNRAILPFELAQGSNRGENFRWSLRGTYRFAQNFSGSLNYTGRQDAGERTFHTGRLEVRAIL